MYFPVDLKALRERMDVTQQAMAGYMGMPLRSYQDIEKGPNPVRPVHERAALFAALLIAAERGPDSLPDDLKRLAADIAKGLE